MMRSTIIRADMSLSGWSSNTIATPHTCRYVVNTYFSRGTKSEPTEWTQKEPQDMQSESVETCKFRCSRTGATVISVSFSFCD